MFHLAFGVVRMALWDKPEDGSVLGDFKAIIRGQITLLAAPG